MRQYFHANLLERLTTPPFLTVVEKRWLAFQLLQALQQCHELGVCHGDIKAENVMVTSWNWLFLTDLANFKPAALPQDDPADFSYFFDSSARRSCYLAPERFLDGASSSRDDLARFELLPRWTFSRRAACSSSSSSRAAPSSASPRCCATAAASRRARRLRREARRVAARRRAA